MTTIKPKPEKLPMNDTQQVLSEMMTENTGKHFLDSGGDNGRKWQHNQMVANMGFDFRDAEPVTLCGRWYIEYTVNVYKFLEHHLEFNAELQKHFDDYIGSNHTPVYVDAFDLAFDIRGGTGLSGEGDPITLNTYEVDGCKLSQVIQFVQWEDNELGDCCLLQLHNGADVRGGYTDFKAFTINGFSEYPLLDTSIGYIFCDSCNSSWYAEGPIWIHNEGSINLNDLQPVCAESQEDMEDSYVYDFDENSIQCPACKSGKLQAGLAF